MLSFIIAPAWCLCQDHMSLPSIDVLTDDEPGCVETGPVVQDGPREVAPAKRDVRGLAAEVKFTRLLGSLCRCARLSKSRRASCFKLFDHSARPLLDLRVELARLHKMDADAKVG